MIRGNSFLLPPKSNIVCLFVNDPLPELARALHLAHIHTTLPTAVSSRLFSDRPNLCPKTEGSGVAEVEPQASRRTLKWLRNDPRNPKPAQM